MITDNEKQTISEITEALEVAFRQPWSKGVTPDTLVSVATQVVLEDSRAHRANSLEYDLGRMMG